MHAFFLPLRVPVIFPSWTVLIKLFILCLTTETGNLRIQGGSLSHEHLSEPGFYSGSNPRIQTDVDN